MPIFPNASTYYKGRTHTQLVVSEGNAPAEKYIVAASENTAKFTYEFGPEGNQEVAIPKGKVVALTGVEYDYETEKYVPAIKIANGKKDDAGFNGASIIGVNHHNVYKRVMDRFSGNQPTIITREYIEVPLFTDTAKAAAIKFGAAWATGADNLAAANAIIGKNIAVDEHGNFTVASSTYENVIGKCLGVDTNVLPAGYLQYFMEMENVDFEKFMRDMSYAPSPGRTKDSAWNDIGTYPEGTGYLKSREDLMKSFKSGIPFLTDGYFKARTDKTYTLATTGVTTRTAGHVKVTNNKINTTLTEAVEAVIESGTVGDEEYVAPVAAKDETYVDLTGSAIFIKLPDKLVKDNLQSGLAKVNYPEFANGPDPSDIKVYFGTGGTKTQVIAERVHIDYTNNQIVVYLDGLTASSIDDLDMTVTCVVLENQIPGIPTGWDFSGAVGAARILLK